MFIVGPGTETVKKYLELYSERSPDLPVCPHCGGRLHGHGHYHRQVILAEEIAEIPIYRAYCRHCRVTGALFPAFLKPNARYTGDLREAVLETHIEEGQSWTQAAEVFSPEMAPQKKTMRRWAKATEAMARAATTVLASHLARLEPTLDQRRLWPPKPHSCWPDLDLLFRYGRRFRHLITTLLPGSSPLPGLFTLLRLHAETAAILL